MRARRLEEVASAFRVEPLEALSTNERDELERAVSLRAPALVKAADFARTLHRADGTEVEVKVWLETGLFPCYVGVHWEDRLSKFYFLVLDSTGRERLAAVVFERIPSVTAEEARAETRLFLDTIADVLRGEREMEMMDAIAALQSKYREGGAPAESS